LLATAWRPQAAAVLGATASANLLVALVLAHRGVGNGVLLAALPVVVIGFGALVASDRRVLLGAALGFGLTFGLLNTALPLPGGKPIFAADLVVAAALGSWMAARALGHSPHPSATRFRTPALGLPFVLFASAVGVALLRGHERYGQPLFGQPMRLIFYAGIAAAIVDLNAHLVRRLLNVVFYSGAFWMLLNALYYLATGRHQTDQLQLSTGGTRTLSLGVAMLVSGSLFLALLNLGIHRSFRLRALDFTVASIALFEIVLAYGRATFIAVAVVLPILSVGIRNTRRALLTILPLTIPILIVVGFSLERATPTLAPTFIKRIDATSGNDANVRWRVAANEAVLRQVHESPLIGVGFGRPTTFTLDVSAIYGPGATQQETIAQDPHDGYVWLLATGGILLLSSFLLILAAYYRDAWLRLRGAAHDDERLVIVWAASTLLVYLINIATEPFLGNPSSLLVVWALLVLPAVVPRRPRAVR